MTGRTMTRAGLARALERRIVSGELGPGDKLRSERSLVIEYGVGRSSVREAMRELADRGLVEIVPGRGTFVVGPNVADVAGGVQRWVQRRGVTPHEVIDARRLIETEAGKTAASVGLGRNEPLIRSVLARLETEVDAAEAAYLDIGFHLCFARASGNPMLELLLASLAPITTQFVILSRGFTQTTRDEEHRAIMEAIAEQDESTAQDAIVTHLETGKALFAKTYDQPSMALSGFDGPWELDELLKGHGFPAWIWD